ncbi:MAG: thioredoxin [Verrucomicrobiota bacterium]|nr:thioredoxin [Verrucomicrobiota bacterium]
MAGNILELTADTFDTTITGTKKPVLVDFWAPWCGPCKAIGPILEQLSTELGDKVTIAKVNVDNNSEIAGRYNIRAIPTMLLFKNGQIVDQIVGLTNKEALKGRVNAHA